MRQILSIPIVLNNSQYLLGSFKIQSEELSVFSPSKAKYSVTKDFLKKMYQFIFKNPLLEVSTIFHNDITWGNVFANCLLTETKMTE